ncbi:hypothetical protein KVR01_013432 [Diaporthe batatas]|uniref:uncharacterized protein n=1 Tax=Diaporthe batatas TaxID=748121 RepID=UPI001D038613|nr:uncharacterized protein KVR01_013432 [Diaporthe batatas]KAG8156641.1 hypothetical protein KVR01_013432 [Diaporthe batatas]
MSGDDQAAPSFGDPNARPPTPQRTPTSATTAASSSPLLETPKQNSGRFDEATGWTPRFAEDYSVFNSTPGNLRGSSGAFHSDFAPLSPVAPATGKKRPLSAEGLALEIATHANHLSTNPQNLPPVDPSRRLPSSPDPLTLTHSGPNESNPAPTASQQPGQRSAKKFRSSSSSGAPSRDAPQAQTATPPPSSRGGRKIAPKLQTDIMQHQNFVQPDFSNAPPPQHPQLDTSFVTGGPEDVFGYPMGPATAPPITGPRPFWGMDMDTAGMGIDVDMSAAGAEIFQNSQAQGPSDQTLNSLDWGNANQAFQHTNLAGQQQEQSQVPAAQQNQSTRRERPLAPKAVTTLSPKFSQTSPGQNYSFGSFQMSMDDPFSTSPGGVDPGLLFSQQSSLSMPMDPSPQRPSSSAPIVNPGPNELSAPVLTNDIRRSKSIGAQGQRNQPARAPPAVSPTKSAAVKPGLSRSFSESSKPGKRTVGGGRPLLPNLAPAPVAVQQHSLPPTVASQNSALTHARGVRSGGRRSPVKSSHHHRLSSLTSIPENTIRTQARQRSAKLASVKFVIGEDGRARTETVVDDDEDDVEPVVPSSNQPSSQRNSWSGLPVKPDVENDECSSSSDDEPIIIPSRNTSFNFPEPPRSSGSSMSRPPTATSNMSQNRRQRSVSERSSFSSSSFRRNPRNGPAASLVDHMEIDQQEAPPAPPSTRPSTGGSLGDAAAELRKVMQAGTGKRPGVPAAAQVASTGSGGGSTHRLRLTPGQRSSSSTISATPSPTHNPSQGQVRCVCNRPEPEVDGLLHLIKCDSCDHMLHGRCVDVPTPQDVPHVYICAFCANTPNMRGGRMRYTGRNQSDGGGGGGMMGPPAALTAASASSPLAHKSFRSFR